MNLKIFGRGTPRTKVQNTLPVTTILEGRTGGKWSATHVLDPTKYFDPKTLVSHRKCKRSPTNGTRIGFVFFDTLPIYEEQTR